MLVDERFIHLNAVLCPLGSGHVLAYMDALSPRAQNLPRSDDALAFACSLVEVGDSLVVHCLSRGLRNRLNEIGYRVFCTELDEFVNVGGSARSLALRLDDGPAVPAASLIG
jgi:N-dimethylarginine dimethylaminohydrolase